MFSTAYLDVPPLTGAAGSVTLPGSKSISNRVLLLAALCQGTTTIHDLLESDDTRVLLDALGGLGCKLSRNGASVLVHGCGGAFPQQSLQVFLGNAGTAMRPLAAVLAVLGGDYLLHGVARMHERPIGDLVDALRGIGCVIHYEGQVGFPPLRIGRPSLRLGRTLGVRGDLSSQFLTALLIALPLVAQEEVVIQVHGELISKPYVEITLALLSRFGVQVHRDGWSQFTIPAGSAYRSPGSIHVEADASSASYFLALGAIAKGRAGQHGVRILGVGADSIQGDLRFVDAARAMGAIIESGPNWLLSGSTAPDGPAPLHGIDLDCNHIPDAAMTLAVMAMYAEGPSTLRNIASWRVKETDRLAAMAAELRKFGATATEGSDYLRIEPPPSPAHWRAATVRTYDDHRMAMCFSLLAFNPAGLPVRLLDPKCVAKTYPDYFETLFSLVSAERRDIPVLCIDGPTASGKGTLAAALAQRLGYHYLDSGALYRMAALVARRSGLAFDEAAEPQIAELAGAMIVRFAGTSSWLDNEDVSELIRAESAGMDASRVSAMPAVRAALLELQRGFRKLPGLVAEGRDMGSVVFRDAALKIYLSADARQRAVRRHKQLISKGISASIETLLADLEKRDERDSTRATAPLKAAEDALLLDNSHLPVEQSVDVVLKWWQGKQPFDGSSAVG
jgi:3-phosphoshikimate 1-carboxyvinyltransferase